MPAAAIICVKCWNAAPVSTSPPSTTLVPQSRVFCLILAIFFPIGLHRVVMGDLSMGWVQMFLFVITCGLSGFWGWVDAAMILNGSLKMYDGQDLV